MNTSKGRSREIKHNIGAHVFGGDASVQTRAFKYFIEHVYNNFSHLVRDNLNWWHRNNFARRSAEAISAKLRYFGFNVNGNI